MPKDILNYEFRIQTKGYDVKEVDILLDKIYQDYQYFLNLLEQQATKIKELQKKLNNINLKA